MNDVKRISRDIAEALKTRRREPKPYDTSGIVKGIRNGVAYVQFSGGEDETPVALTINAHVGDEVMVRSSGGRAYLIGNQSAPPTDDREAKKANQKAEVASAKADVADGKADEAKDVAANADAKSEDALNLAEGVDEHFWHDNTGAHVTQATQEEYEDDPSTAGGNLLMTSQGMAVRDGTTELASFTGTQAQIGKNGTFHVVVDDSSLEFNNGSGNTFDIEAFYRDGVDGGRIIKKVDALNQASLGVQSDGRYSDARLYASFYDDGGTYGSQSAYIDVSADMDYSAKVSLHASDTPTSGTAKSAYADLTSEKFETTVPIVAPNIDSGTTDSSGNIAASGNYTFAVGFNKTFPSVPSVVCSLVDVSSNAYQFVVSAANITTTGCDIKIHNNGTQPRSCKVSWIAMSN